MIRIIRYILSTVFWQLLFNQIDRINFLTLINNFYTLFMALSTFNIFTTLKDLIFSLIRPGNILTNNNFFRLLSSTPGINIGELTNTRSKRLFWLGFTFSFIVIRWFILFKRLILLPFKLGIYTFLYTISGLDVSWILSWFDIFNFNIPKWVFNQYLSLYNNWINWWNNTGNIKSLTVNKTNYETPNLDESSDNKINKIKLFVIVTAVVLIGVGIWYYYSGGFSGPGSGGNNIVVPNPPAPTSNTPLQPISIIDNQTPTTTTNNTVRTFSNPELAQFAQDRGFRFKPTRYNLLDRLDAQKRSEVETVKENMLSDFISFYGHDNEASTSTSTPIDYRVTRRILTRSSSPTSPTGSDGSDETIRPFNQD